MKYTNYIIPWRDADRQEEDLLFYVNPVQEANGSIHHASAKYRTSRSRYSLFLHIYQLMELRDPTKNRQRRKKKYQKERLVRQSDNNDGRPRVFVDYVDWSKAEIWHGSLYLSLYLDSQTL